ncbi:MAG: Rpn family recombination-promoting nuclease/putative transposase [Desulfovibrio sp.]|jgi:hypothetical protein|nr:Rpn family recombination-promoting nuclease/putative transposase [Desulfovibrio sp.]
MSPSLLFQGGDELLPLTNPFVFKHAMGVPEAKNDLIAFINAIPYDYRMRINDLVLVHPVLVDEWPGRGLVHDDIGAITTDGKCHFNIEMHSKWYDYIPKRQHFCCSALISNMYGDEDFWISKKAFSIAIVDGGFDESKKKQSHIL